jgi:hypothetical protein
MTDPTTMPLPADAVDDVTSAAGRICERCEFDVIESSRS